MYIEEFILVDVVTLLYKDELIYNGKYPGFYTNATIEEKDEISSLKNNWHIGINRKCHIEIMNCEMSSHCLLHA